ncbi:MAG: 23S rRNA (adenine(2503)-C(2))-methyltransferase RlmN [Candidatus Woesearchaeota archaeon]
MKKELVLDKGIDELKQILKKNEFKEFRAKQIFVGTHQGKGITEITNIPKKLKQFLLDRFYDKPLYVEKIQNSEDKTIKFLFKLNDGNFVESVLMDYKFGKTLCVSSQVGCRMRCKFCASGVNGLVRNLTSGEILAQVAVINRYLQGNLKDEREISNVVLMGIGEPLDNFDNVTKFIDLISDSNGINISQRNITISTSGLVDKIKLLADLNYSVTLTLSLHSAKDSVRQDIMPIAKKHTIDQLIQACYYYFENTNRRVTIEYILIKDITSTMSQAKELVRILKGYPFHVNLINLNKTLDNGLEPETLEKVEKFENFLIKNGLSVSLRRKLGSDIDAACGQLRNKNDRKGKI